MASDADRQRARAIVESYPHPLQVERSMVEHIASAIAAARAEALEEAARYFEEAADFDAGPITRLVVSASIRALSKLEPTHE